MSYRLRITISPAARRASRRLVLGSIAVLGLAGCTQTSRFSNNQPANLTGSIDRAERSPPVTQRQAVAPVDSEADERPRAVPPDPYKGVRYKGGRDPGTGVAPNLNGDMPPPAAAAPARPVKTAAAPIVAAPGQQSITVQAGESLSGIARKNQVSLSALMQANNLKGPHIVAGQTLLLPAK